MEMRFITNLCTVVSGIRFETIMDSYIVWWMIHISPKNNDRMLFGGMQYIYSRYVTGRQQQRRRLRRPGPENGLKFQGRRKKTIYVHKDMLCQKY